MIRMRDQWAESWLKFKSGNLLMRFRGLMVTEAQSTLSRGLEKGANPRSVGLELAGRINPQTGKREGGSLKLDESEQAEIEEFRQCIVRLDPNFFNFDLRDRRLDKSFRVAIRDDKPVPRERIEVQVTRLENKMLKRKADRIAMTAMMSAMNRSEFLQTKHALEGSDLLNEDCTRVWKCVGDDRVRPSHRALDGYSIVGFDEPFVSPKTGARMMYPGDTSLGAKEDDTDECRCRVRYVIRYGMRAARAESRGA